MTSPEQQESRRSAQAEADESCQDGQGMAIQFAELSAWLPMQKSSVFCRVGKQERQVTDHL